MDDQQERYADLSDEEQSARWGLASMVLEVQMRELAMSQADLVRKSGVSDFTVRKVLRGERSNYRPDRLRKISVALEQPATWIEDMLDGRTTYYVTLTDQDGVELPASRLMGAPTLLERLREECREDVHLIEQVLLEALSELEEYKNRTLEELDSAIDEAERASPPPTAGQPQSADVRSEPGDRSSGQ